MFFRKLLLAGFILSLSACSYLSYCDTTIEDLQFIYQQVIENHPGIYNVEDPRFKEKFDEAYAEAKNLLKKTNDLEEQKKIINVFIKSFNDGHVWVDWHQKNQIEEDKQIEEEIKIRRIAPKVIWIALPTFYLNKNQIQQFNALLQQVPNFKNYDAIIFDLRGNRGGNSDYGSQIIDQLFGESYAETQRAHANKNVAVDWRASTGNLEHLKNLYQNSKFNWLQDIIEGMEKSLENAEQYYRETSYQQQEDSFKAVSHNVTAQIITIIDNSNASAALDFIDDLKIIGYPITFIGKTTKADRLYMDVRTIDLPSGLGTFSFPIKVYRNRVRRDNEPYVPDIEYDTTNNQKLEQLITKIVTAK